MLVTLGGVCDGTMVQKCPTRMEIKPSHSMSTIEGLQSSLLLLSSGVGGSGGWEEQPTPEEVAALRMDIPPE